MTHYYFWHEIDFPKGNSNFVTLQSDSRPGIFCAQTCGWQAHVCVTQWNI